MYRTADRPIDRPADGQKRIVPVRVFPKSPHACLVQKGERFFPSDKRLEEQERPIVLISLAQQFQPAARRAVEQPQIGARIAYNEIDLVLYFCDPANPEGFESVDKLARLCDQYLIPMATNAATAEVLIQGLRRGDFDWRDIVNPKRD